MKLTLRKKIGLILILIIIVLLLFARFYPISHFETVIEGWQPIKDDALAIKYQPQIYATNSTGLPTEIRYRAAKDIDGTIHIAYHVFWDNEQNPNDGFYPWLNRMIYTGGLGLQKIMFGKGDIEVIEIVIDSQGDVIECQYETAKSYDATAFSVSHEWVQVDHHINMGFEVISWNHLFDMKAQSELDQNPSLIKMDLACSYFDDETWKEYEMFKETNTFLKKNRAHFDYERLSAE